MFHSTTYKQCDNCSKDQTECECVVTREDNTDEFCSRMSSYLYEAQHACLDSVTEEDMPSRQDLWELLSDFYGDYYCEYKREIERRHAAWESER